MKVSVSEESFARVLICGDSRSVTLELELGTIVVYGSNPIHSNTVGLYNNRPNNKSCNIHQQKTVTVTLTPNPNPRFYKVKLEN